MRFHIPDMTCEGCLRSITMALRSLDPLAKVSADLACRRIDVTSTATPASLTAKLTDIGYPPATHKDA